MKAWAVKNPDYKDLYHSVRQTWRDCKADFLFLWPDTEYSKGEKWKQTYREGYRRVRVEVKEIKEGGK